ncbi:hypothetical protein QE152_g18901 [Popillia japonica]|uniref:Uncharacterized protein n=1 Tax=Popillia japonica TaxID=7064 RepID=A0AAW1KZR5_POPJA
MFITFTCKSLPHPCLLIDICLSRYACISLILRFCAALYQTLSWNHELFAAFTIVFCIYTPQYNKDCYCYKFKPFKPVH